MNAKTHRTLMLILVAWAGTAGLTVTEHWNSTAWVTVVMWGLAAWIGGKGWAAWVGRQGGN